ncbi:Gmad2 immunoglobulin-like domain-containing protein [Moorena sp. SIO3H5]|uniref:Gmad2 immunoglobulin-like domain-containing protein n=1 Tax=Moorena sp. SIO3H5 TaxID=2607834 RepID=UPI0013BA96E6|nr:Gmad2 immunoglobulin-like domain-containing protein [Moorena sp. SIO3H5]NEO71633.1 LysM peptidoglycan-binding domain-containing protein [Moorena sp. SIO3H5]
MIQTINTNSKISHQSSQIYTSTPEPINSLPSISVRQPLPHDIVDNPIRVCGIATGFENIIHLRVRDNNGTKLFRHFLTVGGNGILANFSVGLPLKIVPTTPQGTLEIFSISAANGSKSNQVIVPIVFGNALLLRYFGFYQYTVIPGDTLFSIAQQVYGDGRLSRRILEANRHQINRSHQIYPGLVLRVPVSKF